MRIGIAILGALVHELLTTPGGVLTLPRVVEENGRGVALGFLGAVLVSLVAVFISPHSDPASLLAAAVSGPAVVEGLVRRARERVRRRRGE